MAGQNQDQTIIKLLKRDNKLSEKELSELMIMSHEGYFISFHQKNLEQRVYILLRYILQYQRHRKYIEKYLHSFINEYDFNSAYLYVVTFEKLINDFFETFGKYDFYRNPDSFNSGYDIEDVFKDLMKRAKSKSPKYEQFVKTAKSMYDAGLFDNNDKLKDSVKNVIINEAGYEIVNHYTKNYKELFSNTLKQITIKNGGLTLSGIYQTAVLMEKESNPALSNEKAILQVSEKIGIDYESLKSGFYRQNRKEVNQKLLSK